MSRFVSGCILALGLTFVNPHAAGASPVKVLEPVGGIQKLDVNGTLFFGDTTGLWKSNGTPAGTYRFTTKAIVGVSLGAVANVNGTYYFAGITAAAGLELWKSNGTDAGTLLVKDINPGSVSSSPIYLTNVNGTLFFIANDGVNGWALWKSDGTTDGTVMVKDIYPSTHASVGVHFVGPKIAHHPQRHPLFLGE